MSNWYSEHLRILQGFAVHTQQISEQCPISVGYRREMHALLVIDYTLYLSMPHVLKKS